MAADTEGTGGPAPQRRRGRPRKDAGAGEAGAAPEDGATVIKKYANRRLYDTAASRYVTLEDLAAMVREGRHFTVVDARTGEDITRPVLGQIIFEQESKDGPSLLPTEFLRQVISYYGDQMGAVVPSYLEASMRAFSKGQEDMREQLTRVMGGDVPDPGKLMEAGMEASMAPLRLIEEQTRRNMEAFTSAMESFSPFGAPRSTPRPRTEKATAREPARSAGAPAPDERGEELDELRRQIAAMQRKVDKLGE